jgi:pimeloyl-ACP methyl ester carboxylesterase
VSTPIAPQRIPSREGWIQVEAGGSGPALPVLLMHGLAMNLTTWRAQLEHLWLSRRAAAFDLPGCGGSDPPSDGDYSLAGRVRSIGVVADALGYGRFVLVGHSYSGMLAGMYAAENPERVAGVVLADGALDPATWPPGTVEATARLMRDDWDTAIARGFTPNLALARDEARAAAFAALEATPRRSVVEGFAGLAGYDARATLARYPGPKLSIAAEVMDEPNAVHHTIPIPLRVMKGVSHMLTMDRPEEFNALLDAFLAGL